MKKQSRFTNFIKGGLTVLISVLIIFTIIKAGVITPPSGTPAAQFYTLSEIYTRLTTNATSAEGGHDFTFSDSLAGTSRTLTEIYDAIPTIAADTVKLGATYLGVDGTLVPSGGDATTADVCSTKTYFGVSQTDWTLATGALTIDASKVLSGETYCGTAGVMANVGAQTITPSTSNLTITQGYHDGAGYCAGDADLISANIKSGINIFGVDGDGNVVDTSSGDAANSDILLNKKAWVDGLEITGNIANCSAEGGNTCYAANGYWTATSGSNISGADGSKTFNISDGYYFGKTATCNDTDLAVGNIKKDIIILGTTGTLSPSGTAVAADVCDSKTFYSGDSWTQKIGDRTACSASSTDPGAGNVYYNTAYNILGVDKTGTLQRACYSTGSAELGAVGNFCGDNTGDAAVGDIIDGKFAWVDGGKIEGTIANCSAEGGNTCYAASGFWTATDNEGDNASTAQTAAGGINYFTAPAGFYDGDDRVSATDAQVAVLDADLAGGNIKKDVGIFGITGTLYGDIDPTKVLTVASANGTYNASNLSVGNVRYDQSFGVSSTGTMSPYPNTPSGISGLNSTVCGTASWTWVADSNYDGVSDDPICVQPNREDGGATKVWNTSVANDNTFIGNYGCSGDNDGDGVGTLNTTLSGTVFENAGYGDDANTALAIADCKDGIRNLLSKTEVEAHLSGAYAAPDTNCTAPDYDNCYNGPLTPKALLEWKGTRLPTHNDFFGVCGNATISKTWGQYGTQIGRTDNVITANIGTWEWLSAQHHYTHARIAGFDACSYFGSYDVATPYGFRAVFRP